MDVGPDSCWTKLSRFWFNFPQATRGKPMRFLSGKLSTILIAAPFLCASTLMATAQQSPGPAPQHLELKDPTPRPPDLKKQYENDPADKARQQQAAMLRNAQIMEQV